MAGGHSKSHFEGLVTAQCRAPLWTLIYILDIVLDREDAVAGIGVGAEKFGGLRSLAK